MHIKFAKTAIDQLKSIKSYIARDNSERALEHIKKIINGTKKILISPYIGKVNAVYNRDDIRETVVEGYKTIYQIKSSYIIILVIYKNIDFDESDMEIF